MTKAVEARSVEEKVSEFEERWRKLGGLVEENPITRSATPPRDGFTPGDYAKRCDLSESHARKRLLHLYNEGKIERVKVGNKFYYILPK